MRINKNKYFENETIHCPKFNVTPTTRLLKHKNDA